MAKITGKILAIGQVQQVSEKFQKLEFIVETQEQYPQTYPIQLSQDKVEIIKFYKVGSIVDVNINIKGRAWQNPNTLETRYFVTLEAWSMSFKQEGGSAPENAPERPTGRAKGNIEQNFEEEAIRGMQEDDDDLPF
jgi:hypothetical protein